MYFDTVLVVIEYFWRYAHLIKVELKLAVKPLVQWLLVNWKIILVMQNWGEYTEISNQEVYPTKWA